MAEFLKEAQLAQGHRVAEVNVDAGGVDAVLDAQRLAGLDAALEFLDQLVFGRDLLGAPADEGELFGDGFHERTPYLPALLSGDLRTRVVV